MNIEDAVCERAQCLGPQFVHVPRHHHQVGLVPSQGSCDSRIRRLFRGFGGGADVIGGNFVLRCPRHGAAVGVVADEDRGIRGQFSGAARGNNRAHIRAIMRGEE